MNTLLGDVLGANVTSEFRAHHSKKVVQNFRPEIVTLEVNTNASMDPALHPAPVIPKSACYSALVVPKPVRQHATKGGSRARYQFGYQSRCYFEYLISQ